MSGEITVRKKFKGGKLINEILTHHENAAGFPITLHVPSSDTFVKAQHLIVTDMAGNVVKKRFGDFGL